MPKSQSKVVSFINMKGGVGKTTLAVNIAYTLSKQFGKRVLLIDVDPQMNTSQYTLNASQVKEIMMDPREHYVGFYQRNLEFPELLHPSKRALRLQMLFLKLTKNFILSLLILQ